MHENSLYLPSSVFIAQRLEGPSKELKEVIQTVHNIVMAIYKSGQGFKVIPLKLFYYQTFFETWRN